VFPPPPHTPNTPPPPPPKAEPKKREAGHLFMGRKLVRCSVLGESAPAPALRAALAALPALEAKAGAPKRWRWGRLLRGRRSFGCA